MGLAAIIKSWLRTNVAPGAYEDNAKIDYTDSVVIDDVLTRLRRYYQVVDGQNGQIFTGEAVYQRFSNEVWKYFQAGAAVVDVKCDIYALVPARKTPEEQDRDDKRAQLPYDDSAEIGPLGIRLKPEGEWEPFDLGRVLSSRKVVREKLMRYLHLRFV